MPYIKTCAHTRFCASEKMRVNHRAYRALFLSLLRYLKIYK